MGKQIKSLITFLLEENSEFIEHTERRMDLMDLEQYNLKSHPRA
jgi:hypothetical protein